MRRSARVLWRIIIPLVQPGIIAGSILVFIPSLGAYVIPRVLGGGKNMMLGNLIELQFGPAATGRSAPRCPSPLMLIVMLALLVYVRNATRSGGAAWLGKAFDLRNQTGFATVAMFTFFMLYLPIAALVVYAFNAGNSMAIWEGFSLRWF